MSYSSEEINDEQLAMLDDLKTLREDLVGELQAVSQYYGHLLIL